MPVKKKTLYKVWCEFSIPGFNVTDNEGVYSSKEVVTEMLNDEDWQEFDPEFKSYKDVEKVGLLTITKIKG